MGALYGLRMPASEYVQRLRSRVGTDFILLPGVTAVIQKQDRFLVVKQRDTQRWSLVGGGVEPGEKPEEALRREVKEELGIVPAIGSIIGAYGGSAMETMYPNGDRVGYVTVAYRCSLPSDDLTLEVSELMAARWADLETVGTLYRHEWIDQVLAAAIDD